MFLHTFHPQPVLLQIGAISIHWYGFLIMIGIVLGFFVFYKLARKFGFQKDFILNLSFWLIIWGLIGARLYHVLSEINYYLSHPLEIFYIWNGGVGIYGAVIAGILVIYYFVKKNKIDFLQILDFIAPSVTLALAIGRWGNYFNQELYGWPSNLPWSIPIDLPNRVAGYEGFQYFHPTFLYESLFCFLMFLFLLNVILNPAKRDEGSRRSQPGKLFLLYIFLYSLWRFFIEFLRLDPQPIFLSLRLGQWTSLVFIIFSIVFYFILKKWYNKDTKTL